MENIYWYLVKIKGAFSKKRERKISVNNTRHFAYVQMSAAEGIGPVDALSDALR